MSVNSIGGSRYFVTFIDDYSRYTHVYFIQRKDQVLEKFKEFVTLISLVSKLKLYVLTMVVSIVPKNSTRILRRKALSIRQLFPTILLKTVYRKG